VDLSDSKLFTPVNLGPITLKNRSIRAAAFEGMSPNHSVSVDLINYHSALAKGGIGMTTVAYAAVQKSGLSFPHQLWLRKEVVKELKILTDKVHEYGALASIQIGHCGNMAKHQVIKSRPLAPSTHFNLYAPSLPRAMNQKDIDDTIDAFGRAVEIAQEAGFDAIEVHAGHGYLISQFLSKYSNQRKDNYGGNINNRMRFMTEVLEKVLEKAGSKTAVLVKMNMSDGFEGGNTIDEGILIAKKLEVIGVHGIILSGGFVSKAPMYVMRGEMPLKTLAKHMDNLLMGKMVEIFGSTLIPSLPFKVQYFLEDAKRIRDLVEVPLIYVGGLLSEEAIEATLNEGFEAVALARALIKDTDFIAKILSKKQLSSSCDTCNHCIAVMYNGPFSCIQNTRKSV
jgi:2,4-dienoyl-CoA reductase-like NADH-dependent reductase (Old Yellow Enzyme family)